VSPFGCLAACAWILSVLPLALESWTGGELALAGVPRVCSVALPWLALAGVPRTSGSSLFTLAFALPPLGLALGLDLAEGAAVPPWLLPSTVVLACGWAYLAELAGRHDPGRRRYPWLWFLAVPIPPVLYVALLWARPGSGLLSRVAEASPLFWLHSPPANPVELVLPLGGLLVVGVLALLPPGERGRGLP